MFLPICAWDGHVWPKKKCLFYMGVGAGSGFNRYRLRFCPAHAAAVDEDLSEYELTVTEGTVRGTDIPQAKCFSCGQPLKETGIQVFITGYPTQDERKDYWFRIHPSCDLPDHLKDQYAIPQA